MLDLAIIIINYGTPDLTKECLESLEKQVAENSIKVLIIDNASKDDSVNILNSHIAEKKWCSLIASKTNLGFAGGNNLGIKSIEAKAYLLLNSDTIAKADALKELLNFADKNQDIGIISCHLEGPNGEVQTKKFRLQTPFGEFVREAKVGLIFRIFKKWQIPIFDNDNSPAEWVCFAAVFIRKSVFEKVGLLDEGFFMYYEDVDFCAMAKNKDIKIAVCENAKIIHRIGSSSKIFSSGENQLKRRPKYFYNARSHYFKKNFGTIGFIAANIFWTLGRIVSIATQVFRPDIRKTRHQKDYIDIWQS